MPSYIARSRRLTALALAAATPAAAQTPAACPALAPSASPPSLATFAYDRGAPLDLRDSLDRVVRGVSVHRVSFASPKGGRATGWLHVPDDPLRRGRRAAGILVLHGAPGDAAGMGFAAEPLAESGAVVLTIDAPFARRDPQKPVSFTPQDSADVVQYVVDLRRALDVLAARADVDAARLGALGISYGGSVGALLAGVEPRLKAHVLAVADGGLAAHYTNAVGERLPAPPGMPAEQWCRWNAAMEPLDATRFVASTRAPMLFLWGRNDPFVRRYQAESLWRAAPRPKRSVWYESGHSLPMASGDDQRRFLAEHLGIAAPPTFRGNVAEYVGTYSGWGGRMDPIDIRVAADSLGNLSFLGPFTGPDDPAGRMNYVGPTESGETFRFYDKRLTFVRAGGRVARLVMTVPEAPQVRLVFGRVDASRANASRVGVTGSARPTPRSAGR